jgi:hypothetical protein
MHNGGGTAGGGRRGGPGARGGGGSRRALAQVVDPWNLTHRQGSGSGMAALRPDEPTNWQSPSGDRWAGSGERSKAVSEVLRTLARAWARGRWPSDKAETRRRGLMEEPPETAKISNRRAEPDEGATRTPLPAPGPHDSLGPPNPIQRPLPWPPATTDTWVLGLGSTALARHRSLAELREPADSGCTMTVGGGLCRPRAVFQI